MFAIVWKDLLLEARNRSMLASLFVLSVLILLVFELALSPSPHEAVRMAPGLLWTAIVLSASIALGRSFAIEREGRAIDILVAAPIDRGSIYLAKVIVNVTVLSIFELMLLPMLVGFTGVEIANALPALMLILVAGNIGIAAVGALFAPAAHATRARELVLPLVALPLEVPLIVACVQATELVLAGAHASAIWPRVVLLGSFDALFLAAGWILFESVAVD
ncbi:MAG: heme exporter protein B [Hyphomicrobiaceae bacterium]|jgi:heme exporter protein B